MNTLLILSPLLILAFGGLLMLLVDAFTKEKSELPILSFLVFTLATLLAAIHLIKPLSTQEISPLITDYIAVDKLGGVLDVILAGSAAICSLLAAGYLREHRIEYGEVYLLLIFGTLSAMLLAHAASLLTIFIALETLSLAAYSMIAFRRTSGRAVESAMKYFLLGSFGAGLFLFGSALLYGATGHIDLIGIKASLNKSSTDQTLLLASLPFLIAGMAFKVSAFPFHMWTPDAYEGAATPITAWMSIVVKSAALTLMIRLMVGTLAMPSLTDSRAGWPLVLAALSVLTMIYGNMAALAQKSVKRMLAYSSISHAGYLLLGLSIAPMNGRAAISAVLFYLFSYAASNALIFGGLILLGSRGLETTSYDDLRGVGKRHPLASIPIALGALSLLGFPPTAGFFAKYYLFQSALQIEGWYQILPVVGIVTSLIGAVYYLRILEMMYLREPKPETPIAIPMHSRYVTTAVILAGYFVLRIGIAPTFYLRLARDAAQQFFG